MTAVVPCHNHARWVWDAVESLARQDYPVSQIVVVDDGSSDDSTGAVAGRLYRPRGGRVDGLPGSPRCVVGTVPNSNSVECVVLRYDQARGPSHARNRGIDTVAARSDIICLLDSDDIYEQGKVRTAVRRIAANPLLVGAVYSDYDTVRPDGLRLRQFKEPFDRARLVRECIVNCDSVVSKTALEVCGLFDEGLRVCEDYDFWLRLSERFLISHVPESLLTIRVGQHSSTSTVAKEVWEENYRRVMEKARARAGAANG